MFSSPGEILIQLGPLTIRWYGFLIAIAFLLCVSVGTKLLAKKYNEFDDAEFSNFAIASIIGGLLGARSWFVLLNYKYFSEYPLETFQIWLGGQSIQGGLLGGVIATLIYVYLNRQRYKNWKEAYLVLLSVAAVVTPLGQALGRWGNFFNEEAYGSQTDLPWALFVKATQTYHHPTFLYESLAILVIFFMLYKTYMKFNPLQLIASYLFMYSVLRLFLEEIRTDSLYIGDYKAATVVCLVTIIASIVMLYKSRKL